MEKEEGRRKNGEKNFSTLEVKITSSPLKGEDKGEGE